MNHLDILIPFALPPAELTRDLLRQCQAPSLAMLLARARAAAPSQGHDPFSRALPHEHWLAERFGLARAKPDSSPPAAAALMRQLGHTPAPGHWFVLHPAHIHVARDHLVLTDIAQLQLDEAEARQLFEAAAPLFTELGYEVIYGEARTWFIRADGWAGLRTSTPAAASGRNVDIWMPEGPGELAWRKLQNEVQMQWFAEPINEAREARGMKTINSIWLWGGADASTTVAADYAAQHGLQGWTRAFGSAAAAPVVPIASAAAIDGQGRRLLVLDQLTDAALNEEWGLWLQGMAELDRLWAAPLLDALKTGRLDSLELILGGADRMTRWTVTPASLRKFWVKPALTRLGA